MTAQVSIAEYLFERLRQLGIQHVFGVPGDYSLGLLNVMASTGAPRWVGTATELGAAYAADGYARRVGAAAILTTSGPGELSALNGIAGAYAERLPVIQIAGTPATSVMATGSPVHHTLMSGEHLSFLRIYREVTAAAAQLSVRDAAQTIDDLLTAAITRSRPVYIGVPEDIVAAQVDADPLHIPLAPAEEAEAQRFTVALSDFRRRFGSPVLVVGHSALTGAGYSKVQRLFAGSSLQAAVLNNGRGAIDERSASFLGVYQGKLSSPDVRSRVEGAPWRILLGAALADTTTGGLSHHFDSHRTVVIDPDTTTIDGEIIALSIAAALDIVSDEFGGRHQANQIITDPVARRVSPRPHDTEPAKAVTQVQLLECLESGLGSGTLLSVDVGTAFYGITDMTIPANTRFISAPVWSSIGYSLPAGLGAALADTHARLTIIIGDGALQMTAAEFGTFIRHGLSPIVIVLDNRGYTIERVLDAPDAAYHDIAPWRSAEVLTAMAPPASVWAADVRTAGQLRAALDKAHGDPKHAAVIVVHLDPLDAPPTLQKIAAALRAKRIAGTATKPDPMAPTPDRDDQEEPRR